MKNRLRLLCRPYIHEDGYSLLELVIVVVLSSLLIGVLSDVMLRQFVDSKKVKESLALREISNRLAYLLQIEASEAKAVDYADISLPVECGPASEVYFRLDIPRPTGDILLSTSYVYYYQGGPSVKRCGPGFNQNGTLVHASEGIETDYVDAIVASNASLDIITDPVNGPASCNGSISTSREITYVMKFSNSGSSFEPLCNVIKARTFYVEDSPSSPL